MKLRNLLFATMFACTFASCSNEDDPISTDPVVGEGPATLSVQVQGAALTKGFDLPDDVNAKSKVLSSLTLIVFNGTGGNATIEAIGEATTEQLNSNEVGTSDKPIVAGTKDVLVLANLPASTIAKIKEAGTNKSTVLALTADFNEAGTATAADNEINGKLTMNSKMYTLTLKPGANVLGKAATTGVTSLGTDPVKLYRNVAFINLASIVTAETTAAGVNRYFAPQLKVQSVFIMDAIKTTNLVGLDGAEWGATATATTTFLSGIESKESALINTYNTSITPEIDVTTTADPSNFKKAFYAYENTSEKYTKLVVKGEFSYEDRAQEKVDGEYPRVTDEKNIYYTIFVGKDADFSGINFPDRPNTLENALYRNLQYNLSLKVTGPGSDVPGIETDNKGNITVTTVVVDFGEVNQSEEI